MEKTLDLALLINDAYDYLKEERPNANEEEIFEGYNFVEFEDLYNEVVIKEGIDDKTAAANKDAFLTALKSDKRFVSTGTKWDINRKSCSMTDEAYNYLMEVKKTIAPGQDMSIPFLALFDEVVRRLKIKETEATKKIGMFYTNLTLDSRFVNLVVDNRWDLKENHTLDISKEDLKRVYENDDVEEIGNYDKDELDADEKAELGYTDDDSADGSEESGEDY